MSGPIIRIFTSATVVAGLLSVPASAQMPANQALLQKYCLACHSNKLKTAGLSVEGLDPTSVAGKSEIIEKILRKVKAGQMPPPNMPRPDAATVAAFSSSLETSLDAEAAAHPDPGRPAIHRLNRAEYSNAVRDVPRGSR